jgi:pyruvate/2-oxoglutarate dehydrogenase complex dihydrolipoamide dehydrogenase (E3) component
MAQTYDAIVIGTGQAGPTLAADLAGAGKRVAIVERHRFGGTCVNVGCIPTKALVASARAAHVARRAADYGVVINGEVRVDMARVRARKDEIVRRSNEGVERWLKGLDNCTVLEGHGRFETPHQVRVGDQLLEAEQIFVNVGARAYIPPLPGLDQVDYLTNSGIMRLDTLPDHLVIVGGGYIGLEFAQMYRRFGSQVTLIEMGNRLIRRESEDVSLAVQEILEAEGVTVRLNAECLTVEPQGNRLEVGVACAEGGPTVEGSHLLLAVGRRPNTDDLGLDAAGLDHSARGHIQVDDALQTNVPGVWALGECNGRGAFTHTAYNDYEIVAANLLRGDPRRVTDRIDCYGLYIDPPLGRIGMTEAQVRASGRPALVATRPMTRVGRAVEKGETQGFMKVLVDAETEQILGAAILGVGGDEVVHCLLDIMYAKAPYTVIQRAVHIHPTVSELIPTLLGDLKPLTDAQITVRS